MDKAVARMGRNRRRKNNERRRMHVGFWWKIQKETND
jgi:hypothetical protein